MKRKLLRLSAPIASAVTVVALFIPQDAWLHEVAATPIPTVPVSVAAAELNLVCPGALLRIGGTDGTEPDQRERIGEALLSVGSTSEEGTLLNGKPLNFEVNATEQLISASAILKNPSNAESQGSTTLTAAQTQSVQVGRMQGAAASGCIQPAAESWFVAGSTEQGSESVLILVNPSVIASTVTVTAHSNSGEARSDQLVIPSGETRLFQLDAILDSETEFTLQITAGQGKVAAFLQQRETSGLSALGVDLVTPAAASDRNLVVPGLLVRGSSLRVAGEVGNWLRVFNPSDEVAEVLIEVVGSTTEEYGGVLQATVSAKNTVDIPLVGLSDGTYTAFVSSDQPLLAGAFSRGAVTLDAQDIAWSQAAVSLEESFAFGVPSGQVALQLTNPTTESLTLSITDGNGATAFVLPPKSTRLYPTVAGYLRVDSSGSGMVANLVVDSELGFAIAMLSLNENFGSEVLVEVRR